MVSLFFCIFDIFILHYDIKFDNILTEAQRCALGSRSLFNSILQMREKNTLPTAVGR